MSKKLLITTHKGKIENSVYEIKDKKDEKQLLTTTLGFNEDGRKDYSLKCAGDNYIFTDHFLGKKFKLDYEQAYYLKVLLDLFEGKDIGYKVFEESKND